MKRIKLKDIAEITMGQSPEAKYVTQEKNGLPLLNGPAEFTNKFPIPLQYTSESKKVAQKDDILFCVRGSTTGRMNIADQRYVIGRGLASIRHKDNTKFNPYIKALLEVNLKKLLGGTSGSVFPNLTKDNLFELECYVHNPIEQSEIASTLSVLDDKIELNNSINAELEQMAKTLYDYWFVQFDFPNEEGKPYKSSGGKMVHNGILKKEIPEGWNNSNLGKIANLIRGVSYNKEQIQKVYNESKIRILRATNISGNKIDLENPIIVSKKLINTEQILNKYDILMTMSSGSIDHIGKNGFYYFEEEVSFGAFCAKLVPEDNYTYFLYLFMQSPFFNATIKNECLGTNINNLNSSMVKSFKVIKPTKEILDRFNKAVEPLFKKIENNSKQNQELSSLRDWLLPMLMNGQVKVEC